MTNKFLLSVARIVRGSSSWLEIRQANPYPINTYKRVQFETLALAMWKCKQQEQRGAE